MYCSLKYTIFISHPGQVVKFGRFFCAIPDLAVFWRFPGLSPVGWYKLSSGP